jgi:hypothetical protein
MQYIKRAIFFFFLFTLFITFSYAGVETQLWQTDKSQHFIINYQEAPYGYIEELTNNAEKYYNSIVDNLGYRRFNFWSWDNRAKIYMYKDADTYHTDTQLAGWTGAVVDVRKRTIRTFVGQPGFFDSVLPHELTHIVFREFIGEKVKLPLWMDEGIACSQEASNLPERLKVAKNLVHQGIYISLERLTDIQDATLVVPQVFYAEGASVIVFLLENYGKDKFLEFSRELRDGVHWKTALDNTYDINSLSEMDQKWREFVLSH